VSIPPLSKLAHYTHEFQRNAVLNKAVLAIGGLELPNVLLVRNPQERKEKASYALVALTAACLLAPARTLLLNKLLSSAFHLDASLINLPAKSLVELSQFKQVAGALANESLRRKVIHIRSLKLCLDMTMDALIFANLGWIRNWLGKKITGTGYFTGEMGAVSDEKLKRLYKNANQLQKLSEKQKKLITAGLALGTPLLVSGLLHHSLLQPNLKGFRKIRQIVPYFDYHRGILFSVATMMVVSFLNDIGEVISARSPRERNETILKKGAIETLFFGGDYLWLALLNKLIPPGHGLKTGNSVAEAIERVPTALKPIVANRAAWQYGASFLFNLLTLSGAITYINRKTLEQTRAQGMTIPAAPLAYSNRFQTPRPIYPFTPYPTNQWA
jgi:hypothetical protein